MQNKYRYNTVASAIDALRHDGFTDEFSFLENHIVCGNRRLEADDLMIKVFYRYEGNSDPADEATVYGLESTGGLRGILVLGDEMNADVGSAEFLRQLHLKK